MPPLLLTMRLLLKLPLVVGAKVTVIVVEAPGASVVPLAPPVENGAAGGVMPENVRVAVPLFVSERSSDFEVPLVMLPNASGFGETKSCGS